MDKTKHYICSDEINWHVHQFFIERKTLKIIFSRGKFKLLCDNIIIYCKVMTAATCNLQRISRMLRKRFNGDNI